MSDGPLRGAPGGAHRATQMSPSAVPSTLESPKDPSIGHAAGEARALLIEGGATLEEANGTTLRDDAARDAAIREAARLADADEPSARRHGPPTMMSPALAAGGAAPAGPPLAAESAVVDAVLPAAAFAPPGAPAGAFPPPGNGAHGGYGGDHGTQQWGAPGAHAGAFGARDRHAPAGHPAQGGSYPPPGMDVRGVRAPRSAFPLIALIVGGVVVLVLGIAVVAGGALFLRARKAAATRAAKASQADTPSPPTPGGAATAGTPEIATAAPRAQPRTSEGASRLMGGAKARISSLTTGSLDVENVRTAINAVLPRIDGCFAASELEAPNHETAAYDLDVAASGAVSRAEAAGQTGRAPKLDACVIGALRGARLPRSPGGSRVKVVLVARIGELSQTR